MFNNLCTLGISLAIAILILGSFVRNVVSDALEFQFFKMRRHDMSLAFVEPTAAPVIHEVTSIPGVLSVEGFRSVPGTHPTCSSFR